MHYPISHSKPWITDEDRNSIQQLLCKGIIANGETVAAFQTELSKHTGFTEMYTCSSGAAALYLALITLNVDKKDEIILPTYVCSEVYQAVILAGATPVLCDVGIHWNMTPATVAPHVNSKTKAIILVNIFGITQDVTEYRYFGLSIINDLCQNFDAALYQAQETRDLGDFLIFSFHATKCFTSGKGGAVCSNNPKMIDRLNETVKKYENVFSITDLQAVLGYSQLSRYSEFQEKRQKIIEFYFDHLPKDLLAALGALQHRWNGYRFLLRHKALQVPKFIHMLSQRNIIARRGVDTLLHRTIGLSDNNFANAVACFEETVSIPCYPALQHEEKHYIAKMCSDVWERVTNDITNDIRI